MTREHDLLRIEAEVVVLDVHARELGSRFIAADRGQRAVGGWWRQLYKPRTWDVRGVLEDVAAIVALHALQDEQRIHIAEWTVVVVTTAPQPGAGDQRESDRDALELLHIILLSAEP